MTVEDKPKEPVWIQYPSVPGATVQLSSDEGDALLLLEALLGNARAD